MHITISPRKDLSELIYSLLGDGTPHVDQFTDEPNWTWRGWCNDREIIIELIRQPLINFIQAQKTENQIQLKRTVQYLLNVDEKTPYVFGNFKTYPDLKEKAGSVTAKVFASYQDTNCPHDSYALCQWIWEILFSDEDWHTDISSWQVADSSQLQ